MSDALNKIFFEKPNPKKIFAKQLRELGINVHFAIPDHAYLMSDEIEVGNGRGCGCGEDEFEGEGRRGCADARIHQYNDWRWEIKD